MFVKILSSILTLLAYFLKSTCRYHFLDNINEINTRHHPFVFALFHQNLLSTILAFSTKHRESFAVMVSPSADGELVARPLAALGHFPIRGSSSRGGAKALKEIVRVIKNGRNGAITVDGPKGPAQEVKDGIFQLSRLSGAVILPIVCYPVSHYEFSKAWDKFRLPYPFSKIICAVGEPLVIDSKGHELLRVELKTRLLQCEQRIFQHLNKE